MVLALRTLTMSKGHGNLYRRAVGRTGSGEDGPVMDLLSLRMTFNLQNWTCGSHDCVVSWHS